MKKNELTTREQLKAYFETGKHPTESQFSDLIDSLRLKEDILSNKEAIILANRLASIDNGYVTYLNYTSIVGEFPIVISSQDQEDQVIKLVKDSSGGEVKQYFFGSAPYKITSKEFSSEGLKETEYYYLRYQTDSNYMMYRLFGNNLPTIPDKFEFGILKGKKFTIEINKVDYGKKINILNTRIRFINKTKVPIEYMVSGGFWTHAYTTEDIVTEHYDMADYLNFNYNADLREIDKSILCKVYNEDNDQLIMTVNLVAEQNNINIWGGSTAYNPKNLRIECDFVYVE